MTIISTAHSIATFANAAYTQAMKIKFNKTVVLSRIGIYGNSATATAVTAGVRVWDTNNTRLASSAANVSVSVSSAGPTWIDLSSPITLNANTVYYIGSYMSTSCSYVGSGKVSHDEPAVDGIVLTNMVDEEGGVGGIRYLTGDVDPIATGTKNAGYEFAYAVDVTLAGTQPTPTSANPVTITTGTNSTANQTSVPSQRKVDRTSNGVLWAVRNNNISGTTEQADFYYSTDNGQNWTLSSWATTGSAGSANTYAGNLSFFIDVDDYAHIVFRDKSDGYIYYRRGTPNAGRTAWTWSAAFQANAYSNTDAPDVVAHREGTGWKVHIVASRNDTGPGDYVLYVRLNVSSSGTITSDSNGALTGTYGNTVHKYPSIDFHHTGDGKTVAGGTPHLYVAWSAGATGAGKGIRFKKATYASGTWTWGTEREISPTYYVPNTYYSLNCMFDGTRIIIVGEQGTSTTTKFLNLWERDVADTTTTTRVNGFSVISSNEVAQASCSYDAKGNVYWLGARTTSSHYPGVYWKWDRATNTLSSSYAVLTSALEDTAFFSAMRGYMGYSIPYVYTEGSANPYNVKYGSIVLNQPPTAPTNVAISGTPRAGKQGATVTWTHNDPNGDPQTKYKIRWRKV